MVTPTRAERSEFLSPFLLVIDLSIQENITFLKMGKWVANKDHDLFLGSCLTIVLTISLKYCSQFPWTDTLEAY